MRGFRCGAAIVGGLLAGFVLYMLVSFVAAAPLLWVLPVGWVIIGGWAGSAGRAAWGRIWLALAIASFCLPLAMLAVGANVTARQVSAAPDAAAQAGAVFGGAIGTALLAGFTGFVGFFLGLIFALLAFYSLRSARQPRTAD